MDKDSQYINLKIRDGISVTVPSAPGLMTPYILREQQDWFEDELQFLRHYIKPGMRVIDVGANYGVYTLPLACIAGSSGRVWAIEPAADTVRCLRRSVQANALTNVEVIQAGVSGRSGTAVLHTCANAEWNSLTPTGVAGSGQETVNLFTLDQCRQEHGCTGIDLLKLDAEGEELNILEGGREFFLAENPLVMFELKHNDRINLSLLDGIRHCGYSPFRLVPGLQVLVPFDAEDPVDGFLLNLFACKPDRAAGLEDAGLLLSRQEHKAGTIRTGDHIETYPFWKGLAANLTDPASAAYQEILSLYLQAQHPSYAIHERFGFLVTALARVKNQLEQGESRPECLATFSRIAFDTGERSLGIKILAMVISRYYDNLDFKISVPFLPAADRYERLDPGNNPNAWLISSVLEQFVVKHAWSTYFSRRQALPVLARLGQLGFFSEEMARRKELIERNFRD